MSGLYLVTFFIALGAALYLGWRALRNWKANKVLSYSWLWALLALLVATLSIGVALEGYRSEMNFQTVAAEKSGHQQEETSSSEFPLRVHPRSLVADSLKARIPSGFYTQTDSSNYHRLPIVYPYSILTIDFPDYGVLHNEKNLEAIYHYNSRSQILPIDEIRELNFDQNFLLVKREANSQFERSRPAYYSIVYLGSEEIEDFADQETMFSQAIRKGYKGGRKLFSLSDYARILKEKHLLSE